MPDRAPFAGVLVGFARELRAAGLTVGTGDVLTYCSAMAPLDPADLVDLYWAGRATLVSRKDDIAAYDRVFRRFFLDEGAPGATQLLLPATAVAEAEAALVVPGVEPGPAADEEKPVLGWMASDVDALKHRTFPACTPAELAALRRIMARIKLTPPRRRTRRTRPGASGRAPDMRKTIRESMRMHGEPAGLFFRQRKTRLRPLILVLDISGSMADYSRHLLQFAYSARRAAARVEVFCFGTRLTRITKALQHRQPDTALEQAARAVVDWDGGTRIGESLDTFVRRWGRNGLCRGGVVIICSDGLDRGDPELLAAAMERLSRLCYRIVWLNPHKGDNAHFRPSTVGMIVAAPHIDLLLSGHDLASLQQLADMLPALN
ncbi:VWA domain-containing protein [Trebonia sp.]|uniref:vWA domain-containing protein n=1 Tax=Trebonia sp. TaxID=2767075 RepID=UPI002637FA1C|nr:VWA domain-containing protein [Trebonia sp.]